MTSAPETQKTAGEKQKREASLLSSCSWWRATFAAYDCFAHCTLTKKKSRNLCLLRPFLWPFRICHASLYPLQKCSSDILEFTFTPAGMSLLEETLVLLRLLRMNRSFSCGNHLLRFQCSSLLPCGSNVL